MPAKKKDGTPARSARRKKLTDLYLRTLKPEAAAFRVWDTHLPGLFVRVWPSGRRVFYVHYCRGGRHRGLSFGPYPAVSLKKARKKAYGVLEKVYDGEDPVADRQAQRGGGTFEEVHNRYVDERAVKHNKSWRQGKSLIERYVSPRLGKLSITSITRADVSATIGGIKAPVLANQVLAAMSAVFKWAVKQGLVPANPCKDVDRNPTSDRERTLFDSEVPKVWAALDHMGTPHARALQAILLTGQRPGEVSCMRFEHIQDNWWLMPGQETPVWPGTKNKKNHRVWLPEAARGVIHRSNVTSIRGYIFASAGDRPVDNLDAVMRAVCKELNIREKVTPHDLRRTFLTTVTKLKKDRHLMDVIANHRTKTTTDVYDRYSWSDDVKQVMEAVADHIVSLVRSDGAAAIASR